MTTPNPQTVREIAKAAMGYALRQCRNAAVEAALLASTAASPVLGEKFDVYTSAAIAEYDRLVATLSWPDEQQPADPASGEQQDGAAGRVEAFLGLRERYENTPGIRLDTRDGSLAVLWDSERNDLTTADVRAVLAERDALAARVAELEGEQDMCTCSEPRKVCELRTELDRAHGQINAAIARAKRAEAERRRERTARQLDDRHIDRTIALLLMRQGGAVEFSLTEMELAPQHGEFVCVRNLTTGGTRLAFQAADAQAADAAQDGLSATQTDAGDVQASVGVSTPVRATAGLSEPEPCDGDCDCDCQPGQPCLCPERDCYCGPCRVCGDNPQQPDDDTTEGR